MRYLTLLALLALTGCGMFSMTEKTGIRAPERIASYIDVALTDTENTPAEVTQLVEARTILRPAPE